MATTTAPAFPEYIRTLWDGLQEALADGGMDTGDVAAISGALARLAENRALWLSTNGADVKVLEKVDQYRELAVTLFQQTNPRPPELTDYEGLAEERAKED
jgi:hypothetical protein